MPVTEGSKVAVDSDGNDNVLVPPPADTSSSRGAHTGDHKNAMWRGQSNILVAVRVRPDAGKKCATEKPQTANGRRTRHVRRHAHRWG